MFTIVSHRAALRRFRRDESGSLMVFALTLFMLMVMMGGLAVDLMRYEQRRTALQQTSDRASLAAASITNAKAPRVVVDDYFAKAGMLDSVDSVQVVQSLNSKQVTIEASVPTDPMFLHMMGVETLDAPASSAAEQRINNVEIQLVLDISGSMSGAKLTNLKKAASDFITTVLANDTQQRISIGIVPYNAQVNLGPVLRAKYNAAFLHGVANVNCFEVPTSTYASANMSRNLAMPMSAYADITSGTTQNTSYISRTDSAAATTNVNSTHCKPITANTIMLPSNNGTALRAKINGLTAAGNTSTMLGMRWGLALIEPSARPMFSELAGSGDIPAAFNIRPYEWDDQEAMKVIVLMTDGEHVAHDKVNDTFKTNLSSIFKSSGDGNYSIRFTTGRPATAGSREYFVPHLCTSTNCKNGTDVSEAWKAVPHNDSGPAAVQLAWNQVWGQQRLSWVAWQLYARALGTSSSTRSSRYTSTMNAFRSNFATATAMDGQLQQSCDIARANNVLVFGIAFEAPPIGQAAIQNCSPERYYNASGIQISSVFQSIASQISMLRLTQ